MSKPVHASVPQWLQPLLPALWPAVADLPADVSLYGVDFSSSPTRKKPIRIAQGAWRMKDDSPTLVVNEVMSLYTADAFAEFLRNTPAWVAAFDMPFGLSRNLVDTLGWPGAYQYDEQSWNDCMAFYTSLSREQIKTCFQAWCHAHPPGQKFAHRATDLPAKSSPSMKWVNPPVAYMLHAGAQALLGADAFIPGCRRGLPTKIALEAYPGWLARELIGNVSYKTDDVAKQNEARHTARQSLCDLILGAPVLGVTLEVSAEVEQDIRHDPKGDSLDALLCCVQAAWSYREAIEHRLWGLPADADPLEGWIAAVPFGEHTPRRGRLMSQPAEQTRTAMAEHLDSDLQSQVLGQVIRQALRATDGVTDGATDGGR